MRWFFAASSLLAVLGSVPLGAQPLEPTPDPGDDAWLEAELDFLRDRIPAAPGVDPFASIDGYAPPALPCLDGCTPLEAMPTPVTVGQRAWDPGQVTSLPFGLTSIDHPELLEFLDFYATEGRRRATSWFAAAGRWRPMIERLADEVGAPRDLIWIAAIESGFDNNAGSHAGAVGMWQFMERTATSRGLRIDRWVDERRDPEIATRAALEYLQDRYNTFGNWLIGFAAYNAGSGHARGELREAGATDFWAFDDYSCLYSDARRYALRATTLAIIDRNRAAFGLDAVQPEDPIAWDAVEVRGGVRLSLLAEAAGTSVAELRALNPALRQNQTPPDDGGWTIRIPAGSFARFVAAYDDLADEYGEEHELIALRFGETLEAFGARVGLPERVVRAVNDLGPTERPSAGTELIVPLEGRRGTSRAEATAERPLVLLPTTRFAYADRTRVFYTVLTGDTVSAIADNFAVSVFDLCAWNDLDPRATLWSGMVLQVWIARDFDLSTSVVLDESAVDAFVVNSAEYTAWLASRGAGTSSTSRTRQRTYTVRSGDTINGIARRLGVRASDLLRWNDLDDNGLIVVGQQLVVGR